MVGFSYSKLYVNDIGDVLDEKDLYWQRRKATPRVKNIYEIIQKWK